MLIAVHPKRTPHRFRSEVAAERAARETRPPRRTDRRKSDEPAMGRTTEAIVARCAPHECRECALRNAARTLPRVAARLRLHRAHTVYRLSS
ncbi:hypothetical protein GCM10011610_08500 [Nocardia rhizosphaerihabitans]|uniref:Transposase n=1 Tax=Nocardia rhizosphaerihabitans TaxID=1691570 RepID=A0ABQ2K7C1_9NOCA|nr:hypothetical protein GCM10011610_08500 [Nocardia rhizosphaerihabitans]